MQFVYDAAWLRDEDAPPLSLSLPKRDAPFKRRECRPFFAGLLPDSVHTEAEHERVFEPARRNRTVALEVLAGLEPVSKVSAGAGLRHVVETPKPE